ALELRDERTFGELLAKRPGLVGKLSEDDSKKLVDAAQNNNLRAVKLMLEAGWPVGARGQHGGTALHWAAWHGNAGMVKEILRFLADIEDQENELKATPLGWATHGSENGLYCRSGDYVGVVKLLIAAGAKVPEKLSGTIEVRRVFEKFRSEDAHRKRGG